MKPITPLLTIISLTLSLPIYASSAAVEQLMQQYQAGGVTSATAAIGEQLWQQQVSVDGEQRSCASCHTKALQQVGKHINSHKRIEPMAPSVNPERLQEVTKINKWFKRNCKWSWGRECSPSEQASLLLYIEAQ